MDKQLSFFSNNQIVKVYLKKTKNKHMYLKINHQNQIIALVPSQVKANIYESFILQNLPKFINYLNKQNENVFWSFHDNFLIIFGKKYELKFIEKVKVSNIILKQKQLWILSEKNEKETQEKILKSFLKKELLTYLNFAQDKWSKKMKVPQHQINVISKTSAWATNYLQTEKIIYARHLVHYDKKIIDYVIIHELAHYFEPNHSINFWKIVKFYLPNYQSLRKKLGNDFSL